VAQAPRTVCVSAALYPPAALEQASEGFRDLCDIGKEEAGDRIVLTISPRDDAPPDTIEEFLSYALSAALEIHLSESS
jgi:hypothetical protein